MGGSARLPRPCDRVASSTFLQRRPMPSSNPLTNSRSGGCLPSTQYPHRRVAGTSPVRKQTTHTNAKLVVRKAKGNRPLIVLVAGGSSLRRFLTYSREGIIWSVTVWGSAGFCSIQEGWIASGVAFYPLRDLVLTDPSDFLRLWAKQTQGGDYHETRQGWHGSLRMHSRARGKRLRYKAPLQGLVSIMLE